MRLKELRKEKGLLQKEVAQQIGVCTQSYGFYENGVNNPDPNTLIKLANFFGCSIDYLVGRSDDFGNVNVISNAPLLQPDEEKLLDNYRKLNTLNKMHVATYAQIRVEDQEEKSTKGNGHGNQA